jgi:hypothetical protein
MGHSNIADFRIEVTAWCIRARTNEKSYANHQNETMSGVELEEENGLEASRGAEEEDDVENGEEDEEVEVASWQVRIPSNPSTTRPIPFPLRQIANEWNNSGN